MAFSCQTSQYEILLFRGLNSTSHTGSLYSFEAKVLRVLLQLESPKSEYRNYGYVLTTGNTLCLKQGPGNWLEHSPTLNEFRGHIESEF